jgi:hypothetical protein
MLESQHRLSRANPVYWEVATPLGVLTTNDRPPGELEMASGVPELRHSRHGRHVYLAVFEHGAYRGFFDERGLAPGE